MHEAGLTFVPLLVVVGLAFAVPLLLARVRRWLPIPVVVGEILAGLTVGRSGLGLVEQTAVLRILADLGFVFLMFLSGLEIELDGGDREQRAQQPGLSPLVAGALLLCGSMGLSVGAGFGLQAAGVVEHPWFLSLVLVTTSLGVVAPVLKERGLSATRFGQLVLLGAVVADLASISLISVYVMLTSHGLSAEVLLVLVLGVAFVLACQLASRLRDRLPGEAVVLAIRRGGEMFFPDGRTVLRSNDTLTLAGAHDDVDRAARRFSRP